MDIENSIQQEPIQAESTAELKRSESKFGKRFFIILSLALLFVSSIASAFVYIQNTPERVIDNMAAKMSTLKSAHYEASMLMSDNGVEQMTESSYDKMQNLLSFMSLAMADGHLAIDDMLNAKKAVKIFTIEGDTDMLDENHQKFQFSLGLQEFGIVLDGKMIDEDIYLKLTSEQGSDVADMFGLNIFYDQWLKITLEDIEQDFGMQGLSEEVEKQQKAADLTEDQKEQIEDLTRDIKWFEIEEVLGKEMIDGTDVYHYKISLLKDGLNEYMARLNEITGQFEKEQLEYFEASLNDMGDASLDLWIGKKDRWLYKSVIEAEEDGVQMQVNLSLSKHNEPIGISAPQNYKTLEEFYGEMQQIIEMSDDQIKSIYGDEIAEQRKKAQDAAIKGAIEQMRLSAEIYYDDHNFSYLGFTESQDAKRIISAIQENNGGNIPVVNSKSDAYCAYSNLTSDKNAYFCMDSTGRVKEYNAVPKCSFSYYWCE